MGVLIHFREAWRPTSTGRLLTRVLSPSREHVYHHERPFDREAVVAPDREVWILHPQGHPAPNDVSPSSIQVLLLDGTWRQASRMRRVVEGWGRLVSLPSTGSSRYRLRSQHAPGMYSTAEALLMLMEGLGLEDAAKALRVQFELHVYAGLRSRGAMLEAEEFLAGSLLGEALPEVLHDLKERRRCAPDQPPEGEKP